jgi:PadR family transcriptional regulator PadR
MSNMLTVRTAEHGGRLRKYYHITAEGKKRIADFKAEWKEMLSIYQFVTKEDEDNG